MNTYTPGTLSMEWAHSAACPTDGKGSSDDGGSSSGDENRSGGGGWGFWGFIKFIFWCSVLGLILYFGIGTFFAKGGERETDNQVCSTTTNNILLEDGI
jgi:hypothetical protein